MKREWLSAIGAVLLVGSVFLGVIGLIAALVLLPSIIAWLLYNRALVPAFHWPHASFFLVFALMWFAGLVSRFIFGRGSK